MLLCNVHVPREINSNSKQTKVKFPMNDSFSSSCLIMELNFKYQINYQDKIHSDQSQHDYHDYSNTILKKSF